MNLERTTDEIVLAVSDSAMGISPDACQIFSSVFIEADNGLGHASTQANVKSHSGNVKTQVNAGANV